MMLAPVARRLPFSSKLCLNLFHVKPGQVVLKAYTSGDAGTRFCGNQPCQECVFDVRHGAGVQHPWNGVRNVTLAHGSFRALADVLNQHLVPERRHILEMTWRGVAVAWSHFLLLSLGDECAELLLRGHECVQEAACVRAGARARLVLVLKQPFAVCFLTGIHQGFRPEPQCESMGQSHV